MGLRSADTSTAARPRGRTFTTRAGRIINIEPSGRHLVAATAVLIISALLVSGPASGWEVDVFRAFNDLSHSVEPALWILQQMGSAVVLPFAALLFWRVIRQWRPPVAMLGGGFFLGWLFAKVIKAMVDRGRPGATLPDVNLGFDVSITGFGYPSGHAVLAFTLATVFAPYLPRRWRWTVYAGATLVGLTRIYVGAHLPLDIVGGAAFGIIVGIVINTVAYPRRTTASAGG